MGSEMCIRDRAGRGGRSRAAALGGSPEGPEQRLPQGATDRKFRPCLLYTSDAADERSSVDLGGRRIIKKKKKIGKE